MMSRMTKRGRCRTSLVPPRIFTFCRWNFYLKFSTHTQKLHFFSFFLYFIMSFSKKFFSLINIISQIKKTYFNKYIYFSLQNTILRYFFLQEPRHKNRLSVFPITITSRWSCLLFTNRTLLLLPFHHVPFH